ncbi:arsenate reductase (azurin) small subunit [Parvularcula sp. IMCC14364]|uniref:arsenate reductase (azurin) small subunit n=1 Tax=Parvularcula sp. IMCC14364 TaxID=3067902 RepID=UPI002741F43E|nr:arsenate reductase (azurin) small subunit [Parvularcula sp. IMCC14364]
MKGCNRLVDTGRRHFLRGGSLAVAGAAVTACAGEETVVTVIKPSTALLAYPSNRLANLSGLEINEPLYVSYPDEKAPGVLLKLGQPVEGGAGPDGDVVGFSILCPHQGYAMNYHQEDRTMNCPGHYSRFDVEAGGQQVWGQASQNLPQYLLRVDDKGDIYAEGVDELLYGRVSNVLEG